MKSDDQTTAATRPAPHQVVAVVGLGVCLPGASTPLQLWDNIINGRTFFQQATKADWGADPTLFYQKGEPALDKAYSLSGAFNRLNDFDLSGLNLPDEFDPKTADLSLIFWLLAGRAASRCAQMQTINPSRVGVISGQVILPSKAMAEASASLYMKEATRQWSTRPPIVPPP
ncbi:MAG: beta-ketoacyl synthase N-terminal-like domain-containing protein [Candidatus Adiutrix sp.]